MIERKVKTMHTLYTLINKAKIGDVFEHSHTKAKFEIVDIDEKRNSISKFKVKMIENVNGVDHFNPFGQNFKDAYDECWIFNKFGKEENLPLSLAFELGVFDKTVNATTLCEVEK